MPNASQRRPKKLRLSAATADRHILYENAVQGAAGQVDFMERIFRKHRKRKPAVFREDFCGTARMAVEWVRRSRNNSAWGIDLDEPTLQWCRDQHLARIGAARNRIHLVCDNVLHADVPRADFSCAFNFSFNIFHTRELLLDYFRVARGALKKDGIFFLDEFGGPESHTDIVEKRKITGAESPDGRRLQSYTYIWEQKDYNPITHEITCTISFKFKDGTRMNRAFVYPWRLWTVPELREALADAGFSGSEVYLQGWDEESGEPDGVFRRRVRYPDWDSWYGYIAAIK